MSEVAESGEQDKPNRVRKRAPEAAMENMGVSVWLDLEGIRSGNRVDWVTNGPNNDRAVVLLLSKDSLNADAVKKEVLFAAEKGVPIIPVSIGTIIKKDLPDWFRFEYEKLLDDTQPEIYHNLNYDLQ